MVKPNSGWDKTLRLVQKTTKTEYNKPKVEMKIYHAHTKFCCSLAVPIITGVMRVRREGRCDEPGTGMYSVNEPKEPSASNLTHITMIQYL